MTVAFSNYGPTGTTESPGAHVVFRATENSDIDLATITLTLVDPLSTTHTPISLGTFDTANGWYGDITDYSTTGCEVIVRHREPLMPGDWTATATADSKAGSEDGTQAWTFTVVSIVSGILHGIVELLEGTTGTGRTVPSGRLKHLDFAISDAGLSNAGSERPFTVSLMGRADDGSLPSYVSGDHVCDASGVRVSIGFWERPNARLELDSEIADIDFFVRKALLWPDNWALYHGWIGNLLTSMDVVSNEDTSQVIVTYDFTVSHREKQG